jgi:hypothetical protein
MEQLYHLPLWMKQLVFVKMRADLEPVMSRETLETLQAKDCLQMMIPQLSRKGSHELLAEQSRLPQQLRQLLAVAQTHSNVASMCVTYQWTLEQCCANLLLAYKFDLLMPCPNVKVDATIRYLGNETRIGEYLVQIGRLSWDQLDQALRTLNYIQDVLGERTAFGEVAINLGFVTRQECEAILFLKEESKKAFDIAAFYQAKQAVATQVVPTAPPPPTISFEPQPTPSVASLQVAYSTHQPPPSTPEQVFKAAPPPAQAIPGLAPTVQAAYPFNTPALTSMGNSLVPQGAMPMPQLSSPAQSSLAPPPIPHAAPALSQGISAHMQQQPLPQSVANSTKQPVNTINGQQALVVDLSQAGKGSPQANGTAPQPKKSLFGIKF